MIKNLQIDMVELARLKGISIGMTRDHEPYLILTYKKRTIAEKIFSRLFWPVVAVLFCACGLVIWWIVALWM